MDWTTIINIIAIVLAPIVAVLVGQHLQDKSQRRNDKLAIFKILMRDRVFGWTLESVNALNVIDIVFADDTTVREAWKDLFENLSADPIDADMINQAKYKLLEEMADSLGYTDTITWETVQNPYLPKGLTDEMNIKEQQQTLSIAAANELLHMMNSSSPSSFTGKDKLDTGGQ